jgi:NADPH-dependent 2,4-dienoyl-CoA reductase/sulfur reductase-like enzyme
MENLNEKILEAVNDMTAQFCEFRGEVKSELSFIKNQTTKTNGRVNELEEWKAEQKGMGRVVGIIGGFAGGILASVLTALGIKVIS